jgi:hypothetical protein
MNTYTMRITETVLGTEMIIVRHDGANVPCDPANPDYQDYLAWVEAGNTAEPWEPDNAN